MLSSSAASLYNFRLTNPGFRLTPNASRFTVFVHRWLGSPLVVRRAIERDQVTAAMDVEDAALGLVHDFLPSAA